MNRYNNHLLSAKALGRTFLNPKDELTTNVGKAEILLTPGVFLRIGDNSQIRMVSISLVDIQVELNRGEAIMDVDELLKENNIRVIDNGGLVSIQKPGLYKIVAGNAPSAAAIAGKIEVGFGDRKVTAGKNTKVLLAANLQKQKVDPAEEDDLYGWSNLRSEYNSAASLQTAQQAYDTYGSLAGGAGYGSGWLWNDAFDSWAWMPGGDLGFFSPFGYGFFGPGAVRYAPICYGPVHGAGRWGGTGGVLPVAVNPQRPPTAKPTTSLLQNQAARASVARSFVGFRTVAGGFIPTGTHMLASSRFAGIFGHGGHVWAGAGGHVSASSIASGRTGSGGEGGGHFGGGGGGGHFGGGGSGHGGGGGGHR